MKPVLNFFPENITKEDFCFFVPSTREILIFFINQLLKAVSFSMNLQELLFVSFKSIKKS